MSKAFTGSANFRWRIVCAAISGKTIRITDIRDGTDGVQGNLSIFLFSFGFFIFFISFHFFFFSPEHEVSFLRLLEKLMTGCVIEISNTGNSVLFVPGTLMGGTVRHDCGVQHCRAISYFLEPIAALAPFCKNPANITLTGITNNDIDISVDAFRAVFLPNLARFIGSEDDIDLKITKRGCVPLGGGEVTFTCPVVRTFKPVRMVEPGLLFFLFLFSFFLFFFFLSPFHFFIQFYFSILYQVLFVVFEVFPMLCACPHKFPRELLTVRVVC